MDSDYQNYQNINLYKNIINSKNSKIEKNSKNNNIWYEKFNNKKLSNSIKKDIISPKLTRHSKEKGTPTERGLFHICSYVFYGYIYDFLTYAYLFVYL
jgi:hypothetical protein